MYIIVDTVLTGIKTSEKSGTSRRTKGRRAEGARKEHSLPGYLSSIWSLTGMVGMNYVALLLICHENKDVGWFAFH